LKVYRKSQADLDNQRGVLLHSVCAVIRIPGWRR